MWDKEREERRGRERERERQGKRASLCMFRGFHTSYIPVDSELKSQNEINQIVYLNNKDTRYTTTTDSTRATHTYQLFIKYISNRRQHRQAKIKLRCTHTQCILRVHGMHGTFALRIDYDQREEVFFLIEFRC